MMKGLSGLKLPSKSAGTTGQEQNATAQHTATAAETSFTTVAASLPGGATGRPIILRASGSVAGLVQIQFGSQASYTIAVAPNQLPVDYTIPVSSFPNRVNSVNILFEASGAGTLYGIVVFQVD